MEKYLLITKYNFSNFRSIVANLWRFFSLIKAFMKQWLFSQKSAIDSINKIIPAAEWACSKINSNEQRNAVTMNI
jgi:hypothetical protein